MNNKYKKFDIATNVLNYFKNTKLQTTLVDEFIKSMPATVLTRLLNEERGWDNGENRINWSNDIFQDRGFMYTRLGPIVVKEKNHIREQFRIYEAYKPCRYFGGPLFKITYEMFDAQKKYKEEYEINYFDKIDDEYILKKDSAEVKRAMEKEFDKQMIFRKVTQYNDEPKVKEFEQKITLKQYFEFIGIVKTQNKTKENDLEM